MEKELQKDRWYVISAATAGTLMLKTDGADIPVEYSAGQTTFYAATGKYECDDASIIISGPFNGAPASALGGGGTTVYTLGDNSTYRLSVSATTAELRRPDGATDFVHFYSGLHLHGYNVQHGAGASLFSQGSIVSSMSARGFYVEDSGVRIVELDSDETGHAYMKINGSLVLTEAGERIIEQAEGSVEPITMQHGVWRKIHTATSSVSVAPSQDASHAMSMQLLMTPSADLDLGWLTSTNDGQPIVWPFGEPRVMSGYIYAVTLVQLPMMVVANLTPLGTNQS